MIAKATFGGGCFWCTEAIFRELSGVIDVKSGYSGGFVKNPPYREVCTGKTGHAEVIEIEYNPDVISYEDLLNVHLTTHDPTTLNRQGADRGSQYRSIILYRSEKEKQMAENAITLMQKSLSKTIVTEIKEFDHFYEAEEAHQMYYANHENAPYCQAVIDPKLSKFRKKHMDKIKD